MDIFMDTNLCPRYAYSTPASVGFTDKPDHYDQKNGLGCDPTSVTSGSLREYAWEPKSSLATQVMESKELWEECVVETIKKMEIGEWYADPANAGDNTKTFCRTFHHEDKNFVDNWNLKWALGKARVRFQLVVETKRGLWKPEIGAMSLTGYVRDLYDWETGGEDVDMGWLGRIQTAYAASCGRQVGNIFKIRVRLELPRSACIPDPNHPEGRPVHDDFAAIERGWRRAIGNR